MPQHDDPADRCHLGDVPVGLEPGKLPSAYACVELSWWEWIKDQLAPIILLIVAIVAVLLLLSKLVLGQEQEQASHAQIRSDCRFDALLYCKIAIVKYKTLPADQGLSKIIQCMQINKHKLKAKCSRHIYD